MRLRGPFEHTIGQTTDLTQLLEEKGLIFFETLEGHTTLIWSWGDLFFVYLIVRLLLHHALSKQVIHYYHGDPLNECAPVLIHKRNTLDSDEKNKCLFFRKTCNLLHWWWFEARLFFTSYMFILKKMQMWYSIYCISPQNVFHSASMRWMVTLNALANPERCHLDHGPYL